MLEKRSTFTWMLLGFAALLWGSVVFLFVVTIGANLLKEGMPPLASMPASFFWVAPIWIGTPFVGFMLSLLLLGLHIARGERPHDQSHAIALFAIALPWAFLQWLGLGAG